MNLLVTGTPGVGKTVISKMLAQKFNLKYVNEKDFALKNSIGSFNDENELEIPIKEFERLANEFLKENKNVVFDGHTLCEMKLNVDKVILLRVNPDDLELRLENRGYSTEKCWDNLFCEGIDYCKKHVLKNYSKSKLIEINSNFNEKLTFLELLAKL
ncbi:MAG: AAA family ATPase [Candidatus ainarchaeum sp.]|nr:AAA family ATPase [Candidatus ainarchaeum sp.]